MKYLVIEATKFDWFVDEYETAEEALEFAEYKFSRLTKEEIKKIESFYVLESVNPDEDAEDHLDGDIIKKYL